MLFLAILGFILAVVIAFFFPRVMLAIAVGIMFGGGLWWWLFAPLAVVALIVDGIGVVASFN